MKKYTIIGSAIVCLVLAINCSRSVVNSRAVIPSAHLNLSDKSEIAFREVKSKYTVVLESKGGRLSILPGGPDPVRSGFPLMITATLMDSSVVRAGWRFYEYIVGMSSAEAESFRQSYNDRHKTDEYILVETLIRTTAAENFLDLSRYTIYLEDDRGNQVMPAEIEEMPVSTTHMEGTVGNPSDRRRSFYMNVTNRMKTVFLYFPRNDYYGNPTIYDGIEYLKLVFLLDVGKSTRAEGTWVFREGG
jgi:hypothetical protein